MAAFILFSPGTMPAAQAPTFQQEVVRDYNNPDALVADYCQAYGVSLEDYDVTAEVVTVTGAPSDSFTVVDPQIVGLGCAVIVVVVSIVVWGVTIYVIYRICKKKSKPAPAPAQPPTNPA